MYVTGSIDCQEATAAGSTDRSSHEGREELTHSGWQSMATDERRLYGRTHYRNNDNEGRPPPNLPHLRGSLPLAPAALLPNGLRRS